MGRLLWRLGWLWRTWHLARYGRLGTVRFFDWFPLFEVSWSWRKRFVCLRTRGNVSEDCEPCYDRMREWRLRRDEA